MAREDSAAPAPGGASSKDVRSRIGLEWRSADTPRLDQIDHVLIEELSADARTPNNALATRAGIAPSTCFTRVQRLRESGVIRGFHADIDPALAGRPIQAIISVRVQGRARTRLSELQRWLADLPGVLNVYLLGGAHDFLVHVAAPSTDGLNTFVIENLSGNPDVALTETSLIFQHARATRYR